MTCSDCDTDTAENVLGFFLTLILLPVFTLALAPYLGWALWLNWNWHLAPHLDLIDPITYPAAIGIAFAINMLLPVGRKLGWGIALVAPLAYVTAGWLLRVVYF